MEPAQSFELQNGMRFIVAEDHAAPVAVVSVWARAGVCDEPPNRRGIAHFVEHMMFRGSENVEPEEHAKHIAALGGDCNAFTAYDQTVYHEQIPAHALEDAMRLEADRFRNIKFTTEHTDVERKVILEELRVYENQPMVKAVRLITKTIGGDHPYALDPLGLKPQLEELTVDDLFAFHQKCYRPNNVFAVVSGDVKMEEVKSLAEKYFGSWENSSNGNSSQVPLYQPKVGELSLKLTFEIPLMVRMHRIQPTDKEDLSALDLLSALLTDGEASPVREALVKKSKLCVEAGGMAMKMLNGGLLVFFGAFLPPGRHAPRRKMLKQICDDICEDGPNPNLFAQHLKRFRRSRASDGYSPQKRMMGLGNAELLERDYRKYEKELEDLKEVTPERIQKTAQRIFASENTLELDISPEKTKWYMPLLGLLGRFLPR